MWKPALVFEPELEPVCGPEPDPMLGHGFEPDAEPEPEPVDPLGADVDGLAGALVLGELVPGSVVDDPGAVVLELGALVLELGVVVLVVVDAA
jgi:hypothetical protein